jgi:subtilisin family serine protease
MRAPRRALTALLLGALATLPSVPSADAQVVADDPGLARQWGLARIGAPGAWAAGFTGEGVTIAIVDSGVSPDHPDLRDQLDGAAGLVDCVGSGPCVTGSGADDAGHGTHVAGIAAATTGNGTGVAGVAPRAHLLSVRALQQVCDDRGDCEAQGTTADVAEAIVWAADHGADVINLSLGSITQQILGPAFDGALEHAWASGAIPVLASGNNRFPIRNLVGIHAVVVGAVTNTDARASYSGSLDPNGLSLVAPGGEADDDASCRGDVPNGILSSWTAAGSGPGYACVAGTSMAAPHVSGALAVLLSADPERDVDQAVARLFASVDDLGAPGPDEDFGAGRLNLASALGVSATGGVAVPIGDPTTSTTPSSFEPIDGGPPVALPLTTSTTAPAAPTTALPVAPGDTTVPVVDGVAADLPLDVPLEDPLPALPLSLAVLAVITTFSGHAWRYLAGASWARRTPDR